MRTLELLLKDGKDFVVLNLDSCHYCSQTDWLISLMICNKLKPFTKTQQGLKGLFITLATRPLHRLTARHAFAPVDKSYIKLVHCVHVAAFDINDLTRVEIEHFVKVYARCEFVQSKLVDFLHKITGGGIGLLKSVFDELSETNEIISRKSTCRLIRQGNETITIPPKTRRIYSKVLDQLSTSTRLLLKCAVSFLVVFYFNFRVFFVLVLMS